MSRGRKIAGTCAAGALVLGVWWGLREASTDVASAPAPPPAESGGASSLLLPSVVGEVQPLLAEPAPVPDATPRKGGEAWSALTGRVTDIDGRPIEGARVVGVSMWAARSTEALTDTEGRYAFADEGLTNGTVTASANGFARDQASLPWGAPGDGSPRIDFTLRRSFEAAGAVLWDDGSPCPNARVEVMHPCPSRLQGEPIESLTTGEDGRFVVTSAARDELISLNVKPVEYASRGRLFPCRVGPEGLEPATFRMAYPASLQVTITEEPDVDADLEQAAMHLHAEHRQPASWIKAPVVDRGARFEGVDPVGTHLLRISVPEHVPAVLARGVALVSGPNSLELLLPDLRRTVPPKPSDEHSCFRWELVSLKGTPITVFDLFPLGLKPIGGEFHASAVSLADGASEQLRLGSTQFYVGGTGYLSVQPPVRLELYLGSEALVVEPVSGSGVAQFIWDMESRMSGLARIRVRAVDPGGRAVQIEALMSRTGEESGRMILPSPEGHLEMLAAMGRHDLWIVTDDGPPAVRRLEVTSSQPQERIFMIQRSGALDGVLVGGGHPTHAQLHVVGVEPAFGAAVTPVDGRGRFFFSRVDPGPYHVTVVDADGSVSRASAPVIVEPDHLATCTVVAGTDLTSVTFRHERAGEGWLWLAGSDGELFLDRQFSQPETLVVRLPPGRYAYRFAAQRPRTLPPPVPFTCSGGDLEFELGE